MASGDRRYSRFNVSDDFLRYLVAGDVVHHLFLGDFKKEYPQAKVIGVEGLPEKKPDLKFDGGER